MGPKNTKNGMGVLNEKAKDKSQGMKVIDRRYESHCQRMSIILYRFEGVTDSLLRDFLSGEVIFVNIEASFNMVFTISEA